MLNKDQMDISINYSKLKDLKVLPTLFEFHGSESSNKEHVKVVEEISKDNREALLSGQKISRREINYGKLDGMSITLLKL